MWQGIQNRCRKTGGASSNSPNCRVAVLLCHTRKTQWWRRLVYIVMLCAVVMASFFSISIISFDVTAVCPIKSDTKDNLKSDLSSQTEQGLRKQNGSRNVQCEPMSCLKLQVCMNRRLEWGGDKFPNGFCEKVNWLRLVKLVHSLNML